jgi:hypothetical protein
MTKPVAFRQRSVVLSLVDQCAFSDLLVQEFPEVRFNDWPSNSGTSAEDPMPPPVAIHRSLADCTNMRVSIIFDPDWSPQWSRIAPGGFWVLHNSPIPNGEIDRGRLFQRTATQPPHLCEGSIYIRCEKDNREHVRLAGRVLRLVNKIAINRSQSVRYPSLEVIGRAGKGSNLWIGHDAARWAREEPDRMLDYHPRSKIGTRPLD